MRIGLVSREFPPETGKSGVGTYMSSIARALRDLGHSISVLSITTGEERDYRDDGIHVHRMAFRPHRGLWRFERWLPVWYLEYSAQVRAKLRALHEQARFDILQFPEWGFEGFFFSRRPFCPYVVKVHGPLFLNHQFDRVRRSRLKSSLEDRCERSVVARADAIITSSRSMTELTTRAWGIPPERMTLIPNPIDLELFRPGPGSSHATRRRTEILYVGRLEFRKGVEALCEAIPEVVARYPDVHFTLVGKDTPTAADGGSVQRQLEAGLRRKGALDAVTFQPPMDRRELVSRYQQSDVFLMPSLYEPVGFTGLEAMACGTSVIASRNAGLAEWMKDGVCGFLVEPGSSDELVEKMSRFLSLSDNERQRMGEAARRVAEQFSFRAIGEQLEALYRSVLAKRGT